MSRTIDAWLDAESPQPKLVSAGKSLLNQINKRWPERIKEKDGWFAGEHLFDSLSDHNPDENGLVHALDIDTRLLGESDVKGSKRDADILANELIDYVRKAVPGSERIKFITYNNKIASATYPTRYWVWRDGEFGCLDHIHISFSTTGQSDPRNISLPVFTNIPKKTKTIFHSKPVNYPGKQRVMLGEKNESIRRMQRQLISKGYDIPEGDNAEYGIGTKEAVKSFYHKIGKRSDGKFIGPAAWNILFRET
jgi:hypothetical protein